MPPCKTVRNAIEVSVVDPETVDDQALRLLRMFTTIMDPDRQAEIVTLAERHAGDSSRFAALLQRYKAKH